MSMNLKNYQEKAIKELLVHSHELLGKGRDGAKIVLKAPTGSGKTIMMAEMLKQLVSEIKDTKLSFIWAAPGKLHHQSKDKLERYYEASAALDCIDFNQIRDFTIEESQIVFVNWESIVRESAIITRPNERGFYLSKVLEYNREAGHKIILIIDESHYFAKGEMTKKIIQTIAPDLVIEVSATPTIKGDKNVDVSLDDVREESMIKKSIILNKDIDEWSTDVDFMRSGSSLELHLAVALQKRQELKKAYEAEGSNVNPLMLIQLPDRGSPQRNTIQSEVEDALHTHDITESNRKLAIYLSEGKVNLENIQKPDNPTEAMIFKQAIALGWDCPRAHILLLFRAWKSPVFSIQTVGRIMRMPEPDKGHYSIDNDILNRGYIITNLPTITFDESLPPEYMDTHTSYRITSYEMTLLESAYRVRHREKSRLSPTYVDFFFEVAIAEKLKSKMINVDEPITECLIGESEHASVDSLRGKEIKGDKIVRNPTASDLQKAFEYFIEKNISPFYPEDRTIGRVQTAIHEFFKQINSDKDLISQNRNIRIVLKEANQPLFAEVIQNAIEKYIEEVEGREEEIKTRFWQPPEELDFSGKVEKHKFKKSVMQPFYCGKSSDIEKAFMEFLDKSEKVEWWFKNGSGGAKSFAVEYAEDNEKKLFYVDFVVKFYDGRIGLFDPKSGYTIDLAKPKSLGLWTYTRDHKNTWGGIVSNPDLKRFEKSWVYYDGTGENLNSNNLKAKGWKPLNIK